MATPTPPTLTVPEPPPFVGVGSPWHPANGENRDRILDWWRAWFDNVFLPWVGVWEGYWADYIEIHAVAGYSWRVTLDTLPAVGFTDVLIEDVQTVRPLTVGDLVVAVPATPNDPTRYGRITALIDLTHATVETLGAFTGLPGFGWWPTATPIATTGTTPVVLSPALDRLPQLGDFVADAAGIFGVVTTVTDATNVTVTPIGDLQGPPGDATAIDVRLYGAIGDGVTDDTAAIQAAIDAAISSKIDRVFVPDFVFIVSGSGNMLTASKGIEFFGPGTLKIKDDNGPWSSVFTIGAADGSGMHIHGLTFDGNATNNQPVAGDIVGGHYPPATRRILVRLDNGVGMTVEHCTFYDHEGEWAFICASDGIAANIRVVYNQFLKMGNLTNPALHHDHSTVYIDAIGFEVAYNTFSSYEAGATTGLISYGAVSNIDTHGSGQNIHHNTTIGYVYAGQLSTSPYRANTGIHWHHNAALNCGTGLSVQPYTAGMRDVKIDHNTFELNYLLWKDHPQHLGSAGLLMVESTGGECREVEITHNSFRWIEATHTGQSQIGAGIQSPGIRWERIGSAWDRNLIIAKNNITGAPNNGVSVKLSNADGVVVSDNIITDANSTADPSTTYGVALFVDASTSITNAKVERNQIRDTQSPSNAPYGNTAKTASSAMSLWFTLGYMRGANNNTASAAVGWIKLLREFDKTVHEPPPLQISKSYLTQHVTRATLALVADEAYFMPVQLGSGALTQAGIEVVTAAVGSTIEAALYTDAAGLPGTKLHDLGTIDSTATSWRTTPADVWPVQAGVYWIAVVAHGGTPTVRIGTGRSTLVRAGTFAAVTATDATGVRTTGVASLPAVAPPPASFVAAPVAYVVGA